ncbi:hypothetical protein PINS_up016087 [Pythium insidiosum]|nr:hypothetical protein PINS_up016087 [Pythium insidiosum]
MSVKEQRIRHREAQRQFMKRKRARINALRQVIVGQCPEDKLQLWRKELHVMIALFETILVSVDVVCGFDDHVEIGDGSTRTVPLSFTRTRNEQRNWADPNVWYTHFGRAQSPAYLTRWFLVY